MYRATQEGSLSTMKTSQSWKVSGTRLMIFLIKILSFEVVDPHLNWERGLVKPLVSGDVKFWVVVRVVGFVVIPKVNSSYVRAEPVEGVLDDVNG